MTTAMSRTMMEAAEDKMAIAVVFMVPTPETHKILNIISLKDRESPILSVRRTSLAKSLLVL